MNFPRLYLFGEKDPRGMPSHLFWTVSTLDYSTAQRADISKQNYTVCPRHWYVDAIFVCHDCRSEFVFSASEQKFWYEDKQFYVDSLPKRCATCRKAERSRLDLRKRYDALITTALGKSSPATKKEAVEIINELESSEDEIPERMQQHRTTLLAQLAKTA